MQSAKNQTTTRISAVNKAKKNKQTNKDDRKQTEAASPFSFPAQLRANRHVQDPNQNRPNFNLFFSLTRRSGLPHILSTPCPLVSPPVNIGLKHLILCAQKAASAFSTLLYSCQSPIVACDCTLCIIRDTLFPSIVRSGQKVRQEDTSSPLNRSGPSKSVHLSFFTISSSQPSPTPSCLQSTWPYYFFFSATTSLSSAWSPYNRVQM